MKFRKKPVVIDAWKWTGKITPELDKIISHQPFFFRAFLKTDGQTGYDFFIKTLEGDMLVSLGDYIIRGVNGEYYPCKPDIFEKTYERVEEQKELV